MYMHTHLTVSMVRPCHMSINQELEDDEVLIFFMWCLCLQVYLLILL